MGTRTATGTNGSEDARTVRGRVWLQIWRLTLGMMYVFMAITVRMKELVLLTLA
jgi:hypothetical protein